MDMVMSKFIEHCDSGDFAVVGCAPARDRESAEVGCGRQRQATPSASGELLSRSRPSVRPGSGARCGHRQANASTAREAGAL